MDNVGVLESKLRKAPRRRRVIFLLPPELHLLDLAGPAQAFDSARREGAAYTVHFCASGPEIRTAQGLSLAHLEPPLAVTPDDLIIVPGMSCHGGVPTGPFFSLEVKNWLLQAHRSGVQIASVCSGAVALGEVGLLDGRRCTTHWSILETLKTRHPTAEFVDNVLFTQDQGIITSAGVTSGIDMALWLIEGDYGPMFAARVARNLVVYLRRDGSQGQRSVYLEFRTHNHPGVHRVQDWVVQHATEKLTLEGLAEIARMSPRHLARAFKEATGFTPLQYQQQIRLELAASLMKDPRLTVEAIAAKCGFEDPRHFRRLWKEAFGTPPSAIRPQERELSV